MDIGVIAIGTIIIMCTVAAFVVNRGTSQDPGENSSAPVSTAPMSQTTEASADPAVSEEAIPTESWMAETLCKSAVKNDVHLSEDILTYTDIDTMEIGKGSNDPFYSVDGYVNYVEFSCLGIRFHRNGTWNEHSFNVSIGGVDYERIGDY
jgi:hypothetical protein